MVKYLPTVQETQSWEDPLEKGMTIHSSILAWRITWTEEHGSYNLWGCKESDMTEQLTPFLLHLAVPDFMLYNNWGT